MAELKAANEALQGETQDWKDKFLKEADYHYRTMEKLDDAQQEVKRLQAEIADLKRKIKQLQEKDK